MIKLYDFPLSGHAHKVRLMLSLLGIDYQRQEVALAKGEQRSEEYSSLNPFQKVPVLEEDGQIIRDSNAILTYLARKYGPQWYPADPVTSARIQEWLAISTRELVEGPGFARLVNVFGAQLDHQAAIEKSHQLLGIVEKHLYHREWLATDEVTIADISMYTYVAHAPEGDVSLDSYPHVRAWLKRIEQLPGFIPMPQTAVGLAA